MNRNKEEKTAHKHEASMKTMYNHHRRLHQRSVRKTALSSALRQRNFNAINGRVDGVERSRESTTVSDFDMKSEAYLNCKFPSSSSLSLHTPNEKVKDKSRTKVSLPKKMNYIFLNFPSREREHCICCSCVLLCAQLHTINKKKTLEIYQK